MTSFVEHSDCTTQPNNCLGTDCEVTKTKTSAITNHPKSPRKRRRCAGEPADSKRTERKPCTDREVPKKKPRVNRNNVVTGELTDVPVEGPMAHGTKRKAGTDSATPGKKRRGGTAHSSEPTSVSAESVKEAEKKAGAEQPPATETPRRTRKESGRDLCESSGRTSSSQQNDGSTSISFTNCKRKLIM